MLTIGFRRRSASQVFDLESASGVRASRRFTSTGAGASASERPMVAPEGGARPAAAASASGPRRGRVLLVILEEDSDRHPCGPSRRQEGESAATEQTERGVRLGVLGQINIVAFAILVSKCRARLPPYRPSAHVGSPLSILL